MLQVKMALYFETFTPTHLMRQQSAKGIKINTNLQNIC